MKTEILKIYDEDGLYDLCECEVDSTRIIRIIEPAKRQTWEPDREYGYQYSYACGYQD